MRREGALSLQEFKTRLPSLSKDQGSFFTAPERKRATAAGRAAQYFELGYKNVSALGGGGEAWKRAGYPLAGA